MNNIFPNYSMWRKKYAKADLLVYFIVIIMEIVIFFILKEKNMILESIPVYIKNYFVTPIFWITVTGIVSIILTFVIKNEKHKNYIPILCFTCMVGVVAIIHNVFFVIMLLFCIPISMTIVFGDKILLYVTTFDSTLFIVAEVYYCYTKRFAARQNAYFLPSVLIALVGIWVCSGIAATLIDLLNKQHKELLDAIEEANRANEAKSAFLSNISHEIRTPMNAIVGITDVMLREEREPIEEKYLINIKHSGAALLAIINDILDFSKIESGKMELVDDAYSIYDMLDDLSLIFWNRIGDKKIELLYDIDSALPIELYGDALRVRQIIINLVNNAIKFTEEGFVKLSVKVVEKNDKDITLSISVIDSGQEIKQEDMSKLFASFEQINTKKNHKIEGTGLGLAISKQLVELMNGHIEDESEYTKGTTFRFTIIQKLVDEKTKDGIFEGRQIVDKLRDINADIETENGLLRQSIEDLISQMGLSVSKYSDICFTDPASMRKVKASKKLVLVNPYKDIHDADGGIIVEKPVWIRTLHNALIVDNKKKEINDNVTFEGKKILLVEDNAVNMKVALLLFKPLLIDIDTAENGQIACEKIIKNKYDLVFMDQMMPVMDGVEATRTIRQMEGEYFAKLPIIALTANAISYSWNELHEAGMNDVAVKPIDMKNIINVLNKWL